MSDIRLPGKGNSKSRGARPVYYQVDSDHEVVNRDLSPSESVRVCMSFGPASVLPKTHLSALESLRNLLKVQDQKLILASGTDISNPGTS